jgi:hypothetical protein
MPALAAISAAIGRRRMTRGRGKRWYRRNFSSVVRFTDEEVPLTCEDTLRIYLLSVLIISIGFSESLAQTAAPPSAAPAPAAPSAAPTAPATGAPALSPTPNAPSPTGVVVPPTPSVNSTPTQSNVDLHPPSRLTNPGGPAGPPAQGQVAPATPPQDQATQGTGRPHPGGANTTAPAKEPKKTGTDYSLSDCMRIWDAETHMTQGQWRAACARVQGRINNLKVVAEEAGTKKAKAAERPSDGRRSAKAVPGKENAR